jgi:hypothetical protein
VGEVSAVNNVFPRSTTAGMSSTCISLITTEGRPGIFSIFGVETGRDRDEILW